MPKYDDLGAVDGEPEDPPPSPAEPEDERPFRWLSNLSPAEYESMRRSLARHYGWRVSFLDRLYREVCLEARPR